MRVLSSSAYIAHMYQQFRLQCSCLSIGWCTCTSTKIEFGWLSQGSGSAVTQYAHKNCTMNCLGQHCSFPFLLCAPAVCGAAVSDPHGVLDLLSHHRTAQHCWQLSLLCKHVQHHDPPGAAASCHTNCAKRVGPSISSNRLVPGDVVVLK